MTLKLTSCFMLVLIAAALLTVVSCAQPEPTVPEMQRERYRQRLADQQEAERRAEAEAQRLAQAQADAEAKLQSSPAQPQTANTAPSRVTLDENHALVVDGRKLFPIGFTLPPPPDGKAPGGGSAFDELRSAGGTMFRTGPSGGVTWDDAYVERERAYMDAAARSGMYTLPWLKELSAIAPGEAEKEKRLRHVLNTFKDHPGLGVWKGEDEPEWGNAPVEHLRRAYEIIREVDPNHPVWIVEAPRGTIDSLRAYNDTRDITGVDIYPVSFPPGIHSLLPNDEISLVGDHAKIMMDVTQGKKPLWLTLQISWSGVVKEGRTLVMPTFHQERFMTYQ